MASEKKVSSYLVVAGEKDFLIEVPPHGLPRDGVTFQRKQGELRFIHRGGELVLEIPDWLRGIVAGAPLPLLILERSGTPGKKPACYTAQAA
jgi:hypothetical protein